MRPEIKRGRTPSLYASGVTWQPSERIDPILNVASADRINARAVRDLIFSESFQESSDGIYLVAILLGGGTAQDRQKRKEFRQRGKEIAASVINERFPDTPVETINSWVDGGDADDWLERAELNMRIMADLEKFRAGSAATLSSLFGIKNFHRFSLEHWKKQYTDLYDTNKSHVPFFMSVFDDTDEHLRSALSIEAIEAANPSLALRVYEWETPAQLSDHLYFSNNSYGPAERNIFVISHADGQGLDGGFERSSGRLDIFNLNNANFIHNARLSTSPRADIVIVGCRTGRILEPSVAEEFGEESFAQRLASYSGRGVIASEAPIGLRRLEFENGDISQGRITPVFNSPNKNGVEVGRRFDPIPSRKIWDI